MRRFAPVLPVSRPPITVSDFDIDQLKEARDRIREHMDSAVRREAEAMAETIRGTQAKGSDGWFYYEVRPEDLFDKHSDECPHGMLLNGAYCPKCNAYPGPNEALHAKVREHVEAIKRQQERAYMDALFGVRPNFDTSWMDGMEPWGPPPHRNAIEIITDPADTRGVDARRVNP